MRTHDARSSSASRRSTAWVLTAGSGRLRHGVRQDALPGRVAANRHPDALHSGLRRQAMQHARQGIRRHLRRRQLSGDREQGTRLHLAPCRHALPVALQAGEPPDHRPHEEQQGERDHLLERPTTSVKRGSTKRSCRSAPRRRLSRRPPPFPSGWPSRSPPAGRWARRSRSGECDR